MPTTLYGSHQKYLATCPEPYRQDRRDVMELQVLGEAAAAHWAPTSVSAGGALADASGRVPPLAGKAHASR
jgi:hypothetical protein